MTTLQSLCSPFACLFSRVFDQLSRISRHRNSATRLTSDLQMAQLDFATNPFHHLLPELLLHVCSFLEAPVQISLALTSKYTYYAIATTRMDHSQRYELLHLIERDFPELLLCTRCDRLYRWQGRTSNLQYICECSGAPGMTTQETFCRAENWVFGPEHEQNERQCLEDWKAGIPFSTLDTFFGLPFEDLLHKPYLHRHTPHRISPEIRDLVLRYEERKDLRFGLPLQVLYHFCHPSTTPIVTGRSTLLATPSPDHLKIAPCIAQGALLLRCERRYRLVYRENRWSTPIHSIKVSAFCPHLYDGLQKAIRSILHRKTSIKSPASYATSATRPCSCCSMMHCRTCMTDCLVTIASVGQTEHICQPKTYDLWITSWHDCGRRGEPATVRNGYAFAKYRLKRMDEALAQSRKLALLFRECYCHRGSDLKSNQELAQEPGNSRALVESYANSCVSPLTFAPEVETHIDLVYGIREMPSNIDPLFSNRTVAQDTDNAANDLLRLL